MAVERVVTRRRALRGRDGEREFGEVGVDGGGGLGEADSRSCEEVWWCRLIERGGVEIVVW